MKSNFFVHKHLILIVFCLLIKGFCYSQTIINPVKGTWANKQMLVLQVPEGGNAFYSVNGSNPVASGFAYDGPVIIDVDGNVDLRVAFVDKDGNVSTRSVSYSVEDGAMPPQGLAYDFIEVASITGTIPYTCGDRLLIPDSLNYSLGQPPEAWEKGCEIFIDPQSVISRQLPISLTDGSSYWRFIISVSPVMNGLYSRRDVPFKVIDWETISITDKKYIYKIDDEWWSLPKEPVKIDRSKSHMIYWQSIDYSPENIVKFFVLPPKPELLTETSVDGVVTVNYKGEDGYSFGILDSNGQASDLYDSIKIDTFHGDKFKGSVNLGVFFDSVYQGTIPTSFNVNKKMPTPPSIVPSEEGEYIRQNVGLTFSNIENNNIYYAVMGPVILEQEYESTPDAVLVGLDIENYKKYDGSSVILRASSEGAAAYKVIAYSMDENNNKSLPVSYSVIIDTCNFYLDSNYDDSKIKSDGSKKRPYKTFEQVIPLINSNRFVHIRANGEIELPNKTIILSSNCQIDGNKTCKLFFNPNTNLVVRNASLSVSDSIIARAKKDKDSSNTSLFTLEHGVLDLTSVELAASFGKNGSVISADNSVINVRDSGITSTADNYTSLVVSVASKIVIRDSRLTTVSNTSVNFSCQSGLFELSNSVCTVSGVMGRIGELIDTHSTIYDNTFNSDLKKSIQNNIPIYMDSSNFSLQYENNRTIGF